MKVVHFLYVLVFAILNCINTTANVNEHDLILDRIQNDTRTCINENIYEHKQLEKCLKVVPDVEMIDDTTLDVVCMSVYDSFLLLCEENQNEKLKKKIPQNLKQFSNLLDSIGRGQTADTFCTTVKENENLKSRNKYFSKTAIWIKFFISSMKEKNTCLRVCSTADGFNLDPLCSLIVWANQVYSEHSNTAVESQQSSANKNDDTRMDNDTPGKSSVVNENLNSIVPNSKPEPKPGKGGSEDDAVPPANVGAEPPHGNVGDTVSYTAPPDKKAEGQKEGQTGQEGQKKKQLAAESNSSKVEMKVTKVGADKAPVRSENDKATKPKEKTDEGELEPKTESDKIVVVSSPSSDVVENGSVTLGKVNADNDDNGKGINDGDGGIIMSNEEGNNENGGGFVIDGNGDVDGLEHEEESDDVQIQSSVKEAILANAAQNKQQTFNEPVPHAGINAVVETNVEGVIVRSDPYIVQGDPFVEAEESHFFTYFISMAVLSIIMYLVFHNKKKLVALAVEGRRTRSTTRRRPNTASYSKLDCNLEEAMVSNTTASVTHVLY